MADTTGTKKLKELLGLGYEDFVKELGEFANDGKIIAAIEAGQKDGKLSDEKVLFKHTTIPVKRLHPTQNEIDVDQSLKFPLKGEFPKSIEDTLSGQPVTIKAPIITLNGKYIIDGHHRWSQVYAFNKDAVMNVLDMTIDEDPIDVLKAVQMAIAATINKVPTQSVEGVNLLKADEETVKSYVVKNISDVTLDILGKHDKATDKESAAGYIWGNVKMMQKTSQPIKGAPDRDVMPQTDDAEKGGGDWKTLLKNGVINFKEPVAVHESKHEMKHIRMFENFQNKNK